MSRKTGPVRKREILDTFYKVMIDEGLEGASIAKIASRMNINPSLVIHYFSTKEEMTVELVDSILSKYEETFMPRLMEIEDPEQRLRAIIDTLFGAEWDKLVDMGVFTACYSLSFRNPKVKESFRRMYGTLRGVLVRGLEDYMDQGIIRRADPGRLADFVIALLEGLDFYKYVMDEEGQFQELSAFIKENAWAILTSGSRGD